MQGNNSLAAFALCSIVHRMEVSVFRAMMRRVACGDSLTAAAKYVRRLGYSDVPSIARFLRWRDRDPKRIAEYAQAKRWQAELHADRIEDIAIRAGEGLDDPAMVHAQVQRAKLLIDTRKWILAKLHPERYGDRLQHEHRGAVSIAVVTGLPPLPPLDARDVPARIITDSMTMLGDGPPLLVDSSTAVSRIAADLGEEEAWGGDGVDSRLD